MSISNQLYYNLPASDQVSNGYLAILPHDNSPPYNPGGSLTRLPPDQLSTFREYNSNAIALRISAITALNNKHHLHLYLTPGVSVSSLRHRYHMPLRNMR